MNYVRETRGNDIIVFLVGNKIDDSNNRSYLVIFNIYYLDKQQLKKEIKNHKSIICLAMKFQLKKELIYKIYLLL